MKKFLLALTAISLALPTLASDFPKGSPKFEDSYRKVMADAKKSGKPVVLVFSASWCPPCQSMKNEVYPSKEVQAFHDKFEWAYIDIEDGDNSNEKAAETFGVSGIPHIQFVDAEGKPLEKQVGGNSPDAFAAKLTKVLALAPKATPAATN